MPQNDDGLIFATILDGKGGASPLDWAGVDEYWCEEALVWIHLDSNHKRAAQWLHESSGLDTATCNALVSPETRPRSHVVGDGLLVNLRGVNLNPGSDPEDMVSLRMWIEESRVITLHRERLLAVEDVKGALSNGRGPNDAPGLLIALAEQMVLRAGGVVSDLDDATDDLEEEILTDGSAALRSKISSIRRTAISIRRFLAPQRDALSRLPAVDLKWFTQDDRFRLREVTDRVTRYVEDLDLIRDRAVVIQEELLSRLAEHTNRTMYLLSIVTAIFLPLGLLTGLLGINVGGMPGVNSAWAFWIVCALLVVVTTLEVLFLRWRKWF